MNFKNNLEINNLLCEFIENQNPFSCIRLGNTENHIINCLYDNVEVNSYWYNALYNVAGVYPFDVNFYKTKFFESYIQSIKQSDIVGWVAITQVNPFPKFKKEVLKNKICFTDLEFLDPCHLIDYSDPWTSKLVGKKVLVVSPHYSTIVNQWKNKYKIWGSNVNKILPFELVDIIKSPHPPHIEGGDLEVDGVKLQDWIDTKNFLENQISSYDFDLLLIGAGAYAPVLASYAKSMEKMAVTSCGATQLFFGIMGKRWTNNPNFTNQQKCFNQYWCYPTIEDEPINKKIVESIEGNCYW